jgi:probable phosphoglycerate mutase
MSARIWLIRHGETQWSRALRHTGRTDIALTDKGRQQATAAGAGLPATPALVLCSPLERARHTAELAGLRPAEYLDDLLEWDYGAWEGRTTEEIRGQLGQSAWTIWSAAIPAGATPGEQPVDVALRVQRVIDRCLPTIESGGDVALVAHGHVLRILTATWLGLEPAAGRLFALDPAHVSALGFEREQRVIRQWNAQSVAPDE